MSWCSHVDLEIIGLRYRYGLFVLKTVKSAAERYVVSVEMGQTFLSAWKLTFSESNLANVSVNQCKMEVRSNVPYSKI